MEASVAKPPLRVRLGGSALYTATSYGHEMVVGVLVEKGADVNQANKNGVTPLMAAAMEGRCATEPSDPSSHGSASESHDSLVRRTGVVQKLLEAGGDHKAVDEFDRTLVEIAKEKGKEETAALLETWTSEHP